MRKNDFQKMLCILDFHKIDYEKTEDTAWDDLLGTCHGIDSIDISGVRFSFLDGELDDILIMEEK